MTLEEAGITIRKTAKGWTVRGISGETADGIAEDYDGRNTKKGYYFFREDPTEGLKQAAPAVKREADLAARSQEKGLVATRIGELEPEQAEWYEQQRKARIEAAREPIVERNSAVAELLANNVAPRRRAQFKRKLVKIVNEGGDADQVLGFDKVVQYSQDHQDLGLPQDETELLEFLAREPWEVPIDDESLAGPVDEQLASELLEFAEEDGEVQFEREAIMEEQGDTLFDVGAMEGGEELASRTKPKAPPETETTADIQAAMREHFASRKTKPTRSERAGDKGKQAKKKLEGKVRKLGRTDEAPMGLSPQKVKEAADVVVAALEYGVAEFDHLVSLAVDTLGANRVREIAPYLEAAWREAGPTEVGQKHACAHMTPAYALRGRQVRQGVSSFRHVCSDATSAGW